MMSDFAAQTFSRLQAQFNALDDFGPAPLFMVIAELLAKGSESTAFLVAKEAGTIYGSDPFIVEGETSNNEVFLEVFRRIVFTPMSEVPPADVPVWRHAIIGMATYLSDFCHRIAQGMNAAGPEASNDERA